MNITKKNTINNTEHALVVKKDYSFKTYISSNYKSQIAYVGNNLCKRSDNIIFNDTSNTHNHTNQYSTDVTNNCKINKTHNVKST